MRHIFIINPVSGAKDAGVHMTPVIEKAAAECGITPEIVETSAPRHATALAEGFAKTGEDVRLYAVGGDGTLNEVFAGAYKYKNAEVASVPCGSGNDFVRSFGETGDFLDLPALIRGTAITIDLMRVDENENRSNICAAITSAGLDAEVAYNIPKYRRVPLLGGTMAYNLSIVEKLLKPLGQEMQVTIDGEVFKGKYLIATVCNGQTYGGGYRAAPMASLQDGVLDIILVKKVSRLLIAGIIGKYKNGRHYADGQIIPKFKEYMSYHTGKEIEIKPTAKDSFIINVDGECGPAPRVYAKVMPNAARFVLPQKLAEQCLKA